MGKLRIQIGPDEFAATLLELDALNTCSLIRDNLPLEGDALHSSWSGEAVFCYFDKIMSKVEPENDSIYGSTGEIFYYPRRKEILMVHGRAQFRFRDGPVAANLFARIDADSLVRFVQTCRRIQREGSKRLVINEM